MNADDFEPYRKPNQRYIDEYDRATIKELKSLVIPVVAAYQEWERTGEDKDMRHYFLNIDFHNRAVHLNRIKDKQVMELMAADDRKDALIKSTPVPANIRCNTCKRKMTLCGHVFDIDSKVIRFVFECKQGHLPRKAVYADGREHKYRNKTCTVCGGENISSSKEIIDDTLILTDVCNSCGHKETMELENYEHEPEPIDENDRRRYCTMYEHMDTTLESLNKIADIIKGIENNPKKEYDLGVVNQMTIPQIEESLKQKLKKTSYIKFDLDKPGIGRNIIVSFSVQDASERDATKSKSELKKLLKGFLLKTNWRLMSSKITYRMGYLQGKLKGYETETDLYEIAREIHTSGKILKDKP